MLVCLRFALCDPEQVMSSDVTQQLQPPGTYPATQVLRVTAQKHVLLGFRVWVTHSVVQR
jgi:hypothetical protein